MVSQAQLLREQQKRARQVRVTADRRLQQEALRTGKSISQLRAEKQGQQALAEIEKQKKESEEIRKIVDQINQGKITSFSQIPERLRTKIDIPKDFFERRAPKIDAVKQLATQILQRDAQGKSSSGLYFEAQKKGSAFLSQVQQEVARIREGRPEELTKQEFQLQEATERRLDYAWGMTEQALQKFKMVEKPTGLKVTPQTQLQQKVGMCLIDDFKDPTTQARIESSISTFENLGFSGSQSIQLALESERLQQSISPEEAAKVLQAKAFSASSFDTGLSGTGAYDISQSTEPAPTETYMRELTPGEKIKESFGPLLGPIYTGVSRLGDIFGDIGEFAQVDITSDPFAKAPAVVPDVPEGDIAFGTTEYVTPSEEWKKEHKYWGEIATDKMTQVQILESINLQFKGENIAGNTTQDIILEYNPKVNKVISEYQSNQISKAEAERRLRALQKQASKDFDVLYTKRIEPEIKLSNQILKQKQSAILEELRKNIDKSELELKFVSGVLTGALFAGVGLFAAPVAMTFAAGIGISQREEIIEGFKDYPISSGVGMGGVLVGGFGAAKIGGKAISAYQSVKFKAALDKAKINVVGIEKSIDGTFIQEIVGRTKILGEEFYMRLNAEGKVFGDYGISAGRGFVIRVSAEGRPIFQRGFKSIAVSEVGKGARAIKLGDHFTIKELVDRGFISRGATSTMYDLDLTPKAYFPSGRLELARGKFYPGRPYRPGKPKAGVVKKVGEFEFGDVSGDINRILLGDIKKTKFTFAKDRGLQPTKFETKAPTIEGLMFRIKDFGKLDDGIIRKAKGKKTPFERTFGKKQIAEQEVGLEKLSQTQLQNFENVLLDVGTTKAIQTGRMASNIAKLSGSSAALSQILDIQERQVQRERVAIIPKTQMRAREREADALASLNSILLAETQIFEQQQALATMPKLESAQKLISLQKLKIPGLELPEYPFPEPTLPKPKVIPIPPALGKKARLQRELDAFAPTHVYVKSRGKKKRVTKDPITRRKAQDLGSYIVDQTLSAEFSLQKAKGKTKQPDYIFPQNYFKSHGWKFRPYKKRKGAKIPIKDRFIERRSYRLDTPSEVRSIHVEKFLAEQKMKTQEIKRVQRNLSNIFGIPQARPKSKKRRKPTNNINKIAGYDPNLRI